MRKGSFLLLVGWDAMAVPSHRRGATDGHRYHPMVTVLDLYRTATLGTPLHLDWILKQKRIVALGEGLKSISDVGASWDGSVHPSALRGVARFTETMDCCGCDPCSCRVRHRLDWP